MSMLKNKKSYSSLWAVNKVVFQIVFLTLSLFSCMTVFANKETNTVDTLGKYDSVLSKACGPANLYLALRLMGLEADIVDVMERCNINEYGETDFSKIAIAAKTFNITAVPVKMNMRTLMDINYLVLLHITKPENHFILFRKTQNDEFELLDATKKNDKTFRIDLKLDELNDAWSGYGLIISKFPITLSSQCRKVKVICYASITGILLGLGLVVLVHISKFTNQGIRK